MNELVLIFCENSNLINSGQENKRYMETAGREWPTDADLKDLV